MPGRCLCLLAVGQLSPDAYALPAILLQYEPELFPGLIYRMVDPKIVLLIFVSGKVVLTGAKKREDIYRAFEAIYPVLQTFRKGGAFASRRQLWLEFVLPCLAGFSVQHVFCEVTVTLT
jgi:hypothetical protein